jgi:glycosyltransferase involved in cell wall biosynthesis
MRVLFVSSWAPFAGTRFGGAKRLYYLARELDRRCELSVLSLDGCREIDPAHPPAPGFARFLQLPRVEAPHPWRRLEFLPGVKAVFRRKRGDIAAFLGAGGFDATLLAFPLALRFLDFDWGHGLGRKVYLEDDLMTEQYREASRRGPWPARLAARLRRRQALAYFRDRLEGMDAFVGISREEAGIVRARHPRLPARIFSYGLPLEEFPQLPEAADNAVLGFIGNYRHPPNLEAARWLIGGLFPHFASQVPGARLLLAGPHLPDDLKALCPPGGPIKVLGEVDGLGDFFGAIGMFINPVRTGRGLRTKAVEAAAYGRPILSTTLGAEGLEALSLGVGDDKESLLRAFRERLSPGPWRAEAARNRAAVEARFSSRSLGGGIAELLAGGPAEVLPSLGGGERD